MNINSIVEYLSFLLIVFQYKKTKSIAWVLIIEL